MGCRTSQWCLYLCNLDFSFEYHVNVSFFVKQTFYCWINFSKCMHMRLVLIFLVGEWVQRLEISSCSLDSTKIFHLRPIDFFLLTLDWNWLNHNPWSLTKERALCTSPLCACYETLCEHSTDAIAANTAFQLPRSSSSYVSTLGFGATGS